MAIVVSYNAFVNVASGTSSGVDLSNHCTQVTVNDGQESREITAMGDTTKKFRAGLGTASIECTFWNDQASGSVESVLRPLITMTTSGVATVYVRKDNSARTTSNPEYQMVSIVDGDINLLDEKPGEVSSCKVKFLPYSTFTVVTTSS